MLSMQIYTNCPYEFIWKKINSSISNLIDSSHSDSFPIISLSCWYLISISESSEDERRKREPRTTDTLASRRVARMRVFTTGAIRRLCAFALAHRCSCGAATDRCSSSFCSSPVRSPMTPNTFRTIRVHPFVSRTARMPLKRKRRTKGIYPSIPCRYSGRYTR